MERAAVFIDIGYFWQGAKTLFLRAPHKLRVVLRSPLWKQGAVQNVRL